MIYSLYMGYYLYYYSYYIVSLYYGYKITHNSYIIISNMYNYLIYPFKDINIEMMSVKNNDEKNHDDWILVKKN